MGTTLVQRTEEILPPFTESAEEGLKYTNAPELKNRETAKKWELQVPKALNLPSEELIRKMLCTGFLGS